MGEREEVTHKGVQEVCETMSMDELTQGESLLGIEERILSGEIRHIPLAPAITPSQCQG